MHETPSEILTRVATPEDDGARLDVFLAAWLVVSRREAQALLAQDRVRVAGRPRSSKGDVLRSGDRVEIHDFLPVADRRPLPEPTLPIEIVGRGEGWIAVDKAAGMPVHPLRDDEKGTALNAVIADVPEIAGVGEGGLRSGVVHRLDVDTSGVLLFATEESSWERLRAAFIEHRIHKTYRAVVHGEVCAPGSRELFLKVVQHRPARVRVVEQKDAETRRCGLSWRPVEVFEDATLLEVHPVTGFLHQIRVSLADLGHPVVGDVAYGAPPSGHASRHLLHAARLRFEEIDAAAPDPDDFARCLARLRR